MITPEGDLEISARSSMQFAYRTSSVPRAAVVVEAGFHLRPVETHLVATTVQAYLKQRKAKLPWDRPSAGSVFKNPAGDFAGRLVEEAGLKGKRIGGAMISPKHANFIVNTGGARARDILSLMSLAREKVRSMFGIDLEPEIQVVGEARDRVDASG